MKILRLRTSTPLNELKGEQFWVADAHTQIRMLPCGHFVITRFDKNVLVPHGRVDSCAVEPDVVLAPGAAALARLQEQERGADTPAGEEPAEQPLRRKPGRPPKAPV